MKQSIGIHIRKLAGIIVAINLTPEQMKALKELKSQPDWENKVRQALPGVLKGEKSAKLDASLVALLLTLLPAFPMAKTPDSFIRQVENVQTIQAPSKPAPVTNVKDISENIPMLATHTEMVLLNNPIMKPSFEIFMGKLKDKIQQASKDQKLVEKLKTYSAGMGDKDKADLVGHAFVLKVTESPFKDDLNKYLASVGGSHPKNLSELGLAISKCPAGRQNSDGQVLPRLVQLLKSL